eukprot:sb/3475537/
MAVEGNATSGDDDSSGWYIPSINVSIGPLEVGMMIGGGLLLFLYIVYVAWDILNTILLKRMRERQSARYHGASSSNIVQSTTSSSNNGTLSTPYTGKEISGLLLSSVAEKSEVSPAVECQLDPTI